MASKPTKFTDRLKVLPLTVLLTVLLWLYADAHLTATQRDLPIHITILAGAGANGNPQTVLMEMPADSDFVVNIQGSGEAVDRIRQQCDGRGPFTAQDVNNLTYALTRSDIKRIAAGKSLNAQRIFNSLVYFTRHRVVVTAVSPPQIKLKVDPIVTINRPVEFRAVAGVAASIVPASVQVMLPRSLLENIGGADQIEVVAKPLTSISALPVGSRQTIPSQLSLVYPGSPDPRVTVTPANAMVTFTVPHQPRTKLFIGVVPVWLNGPPWLLNRYRINVRNATVHITVAGPQRLIRKLRNNVIRGNLAPPGKRVIAFLDITPSVQPHVHWQPTTIRYSLPAGISLVDGPTTVATQILAQPSQVTTRPGPTTGANTQPAAAAPASVPQTIPSVGVPGGVENSVGHGR
jgi:hypothetical protein